MHAESGCPQWVTLRFKASAWVHDVLATVLCDEMAKKHQQVSIVAE